MDKFTLIKFYLVFLHVVKKNSSKNMFVVIYQCCKFIGRWSSVLVWRCYTLTDPVFAVQFCHNFLFLQQFFLSLQMQCNMVLGFQSLVHQARNLLCRTWPVWRNLLRSTWPVWLLGLALIYFFCQYQYVCITQTTTKNITMHIKPTHKKLEIAH